MSDPDAGRRTNAPPGSKRLLAGLTPEQTQAVTHGTGPLLLIAGPGPGTPDQAADGEEPGGGTLVRARWRSRSSSRLRQPPARSRRSRSASASN
jgi:hypothetical protein